MAKSRMISTAVVRSIKFQNMSAGAQTLYLQCVADADDMGVAEAKRILSYCPKVRKPSYEEFIKSDFVTVLDEHDGVVYINDFHTVNSFAKHGASPSIYMDLLLSNCCTKNLIKSVKIKDEGFPMLGDAMNGYAMTGEVEICNAQKYLAVIEDMGLRQAYPDLAESLYEWYQYTDESGISKATDVSIHKLIEQATKRCDNTSEEDVCNYIDKAVANAYKSINWSWFDDSPFK